VLSFYCSRPGIEQEDALLGYCMGRYGSRYIQIGPVIADNLENARRLVLSALRVTGNHDVIIDVFTSQRDWLSWLESQCFTIQRSFTRMTLGSNIRIGRTEKQYAIAGPEIG